ncbi:hypothetical protein BIV57_04135 [Mangrovactinospora gilvigrisea]|uniref:histidine kinase n=1 Tax=Mangrovactinospora gilvigrisea TaxID=1428644 RepID=A0A1J7BJ87_9ACTN|nr:ATP-binding protein [Mangrovactinospora gilvigrisea]OIV38743.1 hypothetical protein BIV57_04135 [Mangrovactinospora gilvigrisea]
MSSPVTDPAFYLVTVALVVACVLLVRQRSQRRELEQHRALQEVRRVELERAVTDRDAELSHLAQQVLPDLITRLWHGQAADPQTEPMSAALAGSAFAQAEQQVMALALSVADQAAQRAEDAAQAAVRTVTRALQALVNEQQGAVLALLDGHHDQAVLRDALAIDHASSQLGRRAQVIAILTGSWPGRQRVPAPLMDVVRGGISRIRDYQRVTVSNDLPLAVASQAVEPVVLAVAELLDNAARHSEPGSDVEVKFKNGHNGATITIDDAGVGLKPEDLALAAKLLDGSQPMRLTSLRNPPRFGLAAVGVLAHRYGFRASVEEGSPYGGARATIFLPRALLTPATPMAAAEPHQAFAPAADQAAAHTEAPMVTSAPAEPVAPSPAPQVPAPRPAEPEPVAESSGGFAVRADGLPQRRRHRPDHQATDEADPGIRRPTDPLAGVAAFARRRPSPTSPDGSHDERNSAP